MKLLSYIAIIATILFLILTIINLKEYISSGNHLHIELVNSWVVAAAWASFNIKLKSND
jgi:hypothetical protein